MKPVFQMPFMCHQTWLATTYAGHAPNPNSIDLRQYNGSTNISAGVGVFATADGTVIEAHDTKTAKPIPYGSVVTIDHDGVWQSQYVHLDDALSVKVGDQVVCGQRIGLVGNIAGIEPHLHYVQLQSGSAVRVTFNGVAVAVHAGAKKPDGTYPSQN